MKCSAVVPLEWALVPTECFMKCSAVVPWGCFMKFSAVVPWEWALVPHRVFHEVFSSSTVGVVDEVFSSSK